MKTVKLAQNDRALLEILVALRRQYGSLWLVEFIDNEVVPEKGMAVLLRALLGCKTRRPKTIPLSQKTIEVLLGVITRKLYTLTLNIVYKERR